MPYNNDFYNALVAPPRLPEDDEQSLIRDLASQGMSGLQYLGESLDKPGQALRGLLAGKWGEAANLIPFSDFLGLTSSEGLFGGTPLQVTDDEEAVSGRDLLEGKNLFGLQVLDPNEEGLDWGDAGGLLADIALDPTTYLTLGGSALTKAGKAAKAAGLLPDAFVQAKRMGKAVKGQASARHALTPNEVLQQAAKTDPNAEARFLNAFFKNQAQGKTLADVPAELMDQSVGGLANFLGLTVRGAPVANKLDELTGGLRYGNVVGRGLNALFDAGHSKGGKGESRYAQEFLIPNERLAQQEASYRVNPLIKQYQARVATGTKELASAYPDERDLINQAYRASEGLGPDPLELRGLTGKIGQTLQEMQHAAGIPTQNLQDDAIEEWLARRRIQDGGAGGSTASAKLTAQRAQARKNIPGGTARLRELERFFGDVRSPGPLPYGIERPTTVDKLTGELRPAQSLKKTLKEAAKQLDEKYLTPKYGAPIPETFDTLDAIQANELLRTPGYTESLTPKQLEKHLKSIAKGTGKDRLAALAASAADESLDVLRSGKYMDPAGALQIVADSTAERVGRSRAFRDALNEPRLAELYGVSSPDELMSAPDAAKQLGFDPREFDEFQAVPKQLVTELSARVEPTKSGLASSGLFDMLKNLTQINKSWMTGALTNPSFPVRNRVSGAATNLYTGLTSPLAALRGLLAAGTDLLPGGMGDALRTPAQLIARGQDIPGAREVLESQAAMLGRTLADDREASNFARELFAAHSGSLRGQHTADTLLDNQTGVGQFVGGVTGPEGADAFSVGKVAKEAGKTWDQLRGREGGKLELFLGAPGTDLASKSGKRGDATSALLKSGQTVNDYVEVQNRFGPWWELVKQGVDPAEAMRQVNRAQINYLPSNYTPFENQWMTLIAPFWKFSKGSAGLHGSELATKPGGPLSHLLQTTSQLNEQNEILPEHVKERLAIPVDKLPTEFLRNLLSSGDPDTQRYITGFGMAYEDPMTLITGGPGGLPVNLETVNELLGRLNPMAKAVGELATGRSFFQRDETGSGRLMDELDRPLGRLAANFQELLTGEKMDSATSKKVSREWSPWVGPEVVLANSPLSRLIAAAKNLSDPRTNATPKALINLLTGMRASDVTPQAQDAVLRALMNESIAEMPYADTQTSAYVPKRYRGQLDQGDLNQLDQFRLLDRLLTRKQKQRLAAERDPVAALAGL